MSTDRHGTEGIFRMMMIRESIASVALTHPASCTCDICRATQGDYEAFCKVATQVVQMTQGHYPDGSPMEDYTP